MTHQRAIEAGARAIVAAEYDDEFYPFETSSKAEQQLARRQAEAMLAALAAEGFVVVPRITLEHAVELLADTVGEDEMAVINGRLALTAAQQEQNDAKR